MLTIGFFFCPRRVKGEDITADIDYPPNGSRLDAVLGADCE